MTLQPTLSQRPLPDNSLAMMPTQDDIARHPFLRRYVRVSWLDWFTGWEILNESGYGAELWLGADVNAALAEWRTLWGGAPCVAVPRPTRQHISSSDVYTPEWAEALAASIADVTPDPITYADPHTITKLPHENTSALEADPQKEPISIIEPGETPRQARPAVLPQNLLSASDIQTGKNLTEGEATWERLLGTDSPPPQTAADRLPAAVVADVHRVNSLQEKNNITHKAGIDPERLEEVWSGMNYSLDNWAHQDARNLPDGYVLYSAPGVPIGSEDPGVKGVLFYVILFVKGETARIVAAAVGNHGELLFRASRKQVRDYMVSTRSRKVNSAPVRTSVLVERGL